ncbi:MAG: uroporphyrinogen decarboxylase, partial [Betaproteobacteria bacterium]|nr:uroporphyrinogen decarboxylase [Betaproteobacteria bacterium]
MNQVFLKTLAREATVHTPVWLMRQAGRYLPEYRATRARAGSFLALAKTPELACEVTLQPLDRYPLLDAAILFSDILTVPDAMGLGLYFAEGEGPRFERRIEGEADVAALPLPDMETDLRYVMDAVRLIRKTLDGRVPLIGFSGSPWTLACYMVEGGGSDDFRRVKTLMYKRPDLMLELLRRNANAVAAYLNAQIQAGAQAVMIFDTWGGVLGDGLFQKFSLAPMRWVHDALLRSRQEDGIEKPVPSIVFTKGGGLWLEEIAAIGCDALGLDRCASAQQTRGACRLVAGLLAGWAQHLVLAVNIFYAVHHTKRAVLAGPSRLRLSQRVGTDHVALGVAAVVAVGCVPL